jgi:hypothetical protein
VKTALCETFQELAHFTWKRLGAAGATGLPWSEETNTETLLATLAERHPRHVRLRAFTRREEALKGSDWEWWIGSPGAWFGMRVQAKRIHRTNGRFVGIHRQKPRGHTSTQMNTLIARAAKDGLAPVYCFYVYSATWPNNAIWLAQSNTSPRRELAGCLIAHASAVRATRSEALVKIGEVCVPWHYLVCDESCGDGPAADEIRGLLHGSAFAGDRARGLWADPYNEDFPLPSVRQNLPDHVTSVLLDPDFAVDDGTESSRQYAQSRGLNGFVVINTSADGVW